MLLVVLLLLLLLLLPTSILSQKAPAGTRLVLSGPPPLPPSTTAYASYPATTTWFADLPATPLALRVPDAKDGCSGAAPSGKGPWAAVVMRGGPCSFADKVAKAETWGASAVLVVNNVPALYNSTSGALLSPCWLNCDVAKGATESECLASDPRKCSACSPLNSLKDDSGPYCCVETSGLLDMSLGSVGRTAKIAAVFVSIRDGELVLQYALSGQGTVVVSQRYVPEVDGSVVVLALLGFSVLVGATYRAAASERGKAAWVWKSARLLAGELDDSASRGEPERPHRDADLEQVHMTYGAVACFLAVATASLLVLFFLVQWFPTQVVIALQALFALGSSGAFAYIIVHPLIRLVFGTERAERVVRFSVPCLSLVASSDDASDVTTPPPTGRRRRLVCQSVLVELTFADLIGLILGNVLAWTWFGLRHEAWTWVLLNILAVSLTCTFLLTVRLPSFKLAVALLLAFAAYDVFMVFVTPLLFQGRSVMVEVATAGKGSEAPSQDGKTCVRREEENVPMLFLVPRFSWPEGYSLLGLGDVILPGLLVVLMLRVDYARLQRCARAGELPPLGRSRSLRRLATLGSTHAYWLSACAAYGFGLFLTFLANIKGWTINGVRGQPALLYLVPCTLMSVVLMASWRRELGVLWRGEWAAWVPSQEAEHQRRSDDGSEDGERHVQGSGQTQGQGQGQGGGRQRVRVDGEDGL